MKLQFILKRTALIALCAGCVATTTNVRAATNNYYGTSGALSGNVWSTSPGGPYTSAFSTAGGGGIMNFGNAATLNAGANTRVVAGINATENFTISNSPSGTISNQGDVVIPITVASGKTLDFGSQAFTTSSTAGYNFSGPGTLALSGGTYQGGFTISAGTVIVRAVNAMGSGAANTLTISGGTIAANLDRDLSGKFGGGITVGGNFTLGATTGLALNNAKLTFTNNVNLGGANRKITIGGTANGYTFGGAGVISNGGLTIDALSGATGRVILLGPNTYADGTTIKAGATLSTNGINSTGVGPITSGPLGVGTLTFEGGNYIPSSGASNTIANPITLSNFATNSITLSTSSGVGTTLSGLISGAGGFSKGGSGTLILPTANIYEGTTTVTDGTLTLNNASAIGTGTLNINAGVGNTVSLNNTSGANLTLSTNNIQTWNTNFTFVGGRALNLGTGDVTMNNDITITTSSTLDDNDHALTVGGVINDGLASKKLTKSGLGRLILTGQSTFDGGVDVTAGTLHVGDQSSHLTAVTPAGPLGTGTLTLATGTDLTGSSGSAVNAIENNVVLSGGTAKITTNGTMTLSGNFSGGGNLSKNGSGTIILSGTNQYSGSTTVASGTLQFAKRVSLYNDQVGFPGYWSGPNNFIVNSGTVAAFNVGGSGEFDVAAVQTLLDMSTASGGFKTGSSLGLDTSSGNFTYSGTLANTNTNANVLGLVKLGANTLTLANANTYTGPTNVVAGTLNLANQDALKFTALTTQSGSTITFDELAVGTNFTVPSLAGSGNVVLQNNAVSPAAVDLNVGSNNTDTTYSGAISGAGSLTKVGTGKLSLTSPNNTFAGGVKVSAGTLDVNGVSSSGSVLSGPLGTGTLTLDGGKFIPSSTGSNTIANAVQLNNVSTNTIEVTSALGNASTLTGNITGAGGFTKTGTSTSILILAGANDYAGVTTISTGTLGFAQRVSFYNAVAGDWTNPAKWSVESGASAAFRVGGTGEFTSTDISTISAVGNGSGGFKTGSFIVLDTSSGDFIQDVAIGSSTVPGLVKFGLNTLTLSTANSFSGNTSVAGGTLKLAHMNALQNSRLTTGGIAFSSDPGVGTNFTLGGLSGSGAITLENDAAAAVALSVGNNNVDISYSGVLSGAGSLVKIGTGRLVVSGASTHSGGTTVNAGTLAINSNATAGSGPIGLGMLTLNTGAILDNTSSTSGVKTLASNNQQTWNGNFTYNGSFAVPGATSTDRGLNLGTGAVTMTNDIVLTVAGTDRSNNALRVGGVISGAGRKLTKAGPGRLFLTGQSTFSGGLDILGGAVHVGDTNSNLDLITPANSTGPLGTGKVKISSAQLIGSSTTGAVITTIQNEIELVGSAINNTITSNSPFVLSGIISGAGGFTKSGNGTLTLLAANTFSGETANPDVPLLVLSNSLALQNSTLTTGNVQFDQAAVGSGIAFTLGGLSGAGALVLENNFGAGIELTVGNNGSSTEEHTGAITGLGGFVKTGGGGTQLGGTNLYAGETKVNGGMLLVNGTHTGGGAYTVNTGGTLGGTGSVGSHVDVASGGAIAPGDSIDPPGVNTESLDVNSLTLASGSLLNFELGAPGAPGVTSDLINVTASNGFIANGGAFTFTDAGGLAVGDYTLIDYSGSLATHNLTVAGVGQPAGFTYTLSNDTGITAIVLTVAAAPTVLLGDYNGNHVVDSADYVLWRRGGPFVAGTDATPATIAQEDYDYWRAHFGNSIPPGAGSGSSLGEGAAVPEPTTCGLLLAVALGAFGCRRCRASRSNF